MLNFAHYYKIINIIVGGITVYMVYYFGRIEKSLGVFFHDKTMFHYIPLTVTKWMIRRMNSIIFISSTVFDSTFIMGGFTAAHVFRAPTILTFFGTEFFVVRFISYKIFATFEAFYLNFMTIAPPSLVITFYRTVFALVGGVNISIEYLSTILTFALHKSPPYKCVIKYNTILFYSQAFSPEYCAIAQKRVDYELSQLRLPL